MISVRDLPAVNAILNATCAVLLVSGYILIRRRSKPAHKRVMITAFVISCAVLRCYLIYHCHVGSVHVPHTVFLRAVYWSILSTHTALAATVPVLAIIT